VQYTSPLAFVGGGAATRVWKYVGSFLGPPRCSTPIPQPLSEEM